MQGNKLSQYLLVVLILSVSIGCQQQYSRAASDLGVEYEKREKVMPEDSLGLSDEDYWLDPLKTRDEIEDRLLDEGENTLLLGAPGKMVLRAQRSLPLVVLRVASLAQLGELSFDQQALVTAVDLATNRVYADLAVFHSGRNLAPPEVSAEPALPGMGGEAYVIDVIDRLNLPEKPGDYLLRVIMREYLSEALPVEMLTSPSEFIDPEVVQFKKEELQRAQIPKPWPGQVVGKDFPSVYQLLESTPQVPEAIDIALEVKRVSVIGSADPLVLHGSFRLPVLSEHILDEERDPHLAARASWLRDIPEEAPQPKAVVPITLVVTGSQSAAPFVWRLILPVYDELLVGDDGVVATGTFAVDLMALGRLGSSEQTWFLYALSAEVIEGPEMMAFVRTQ